MDDNEQLSVVEPDIQDLIARWASESKRLLVALPGVLAKLEDLASETEGLRRRLADLERENVALRQSREELAETFTKLRTLIAGTALDTAVTEPEPPRPVWARRDTASVEPPPVSADSATVSPPPPEPESSPAPQPVSAEPDPRAASREDKPPAAKREAPASPPTSVRFASVFRPPTRS
jgi:hypothetical protein